MRSGGQGKAPGAARRLSQAASVVVLALLTGAIGPPTAARAAAVQGPPSDLQLAANEPQRDLDQLSISELAQVDVTSVTKASQPLSAAPASIYVITHDQIVRSGATSLPEILRMAPNLFVAQTSASSWVITARGLSGNAADQNFTNKLLVLIDGRSVYTPLYSGVYWDAQGVLPEDIDHIEVISGPGATLWGANAVNGVINIITKASYDTQGGLVDVGGGDQQNLLAMRWGGRISDDLTYRVYAMDQLWNNTVTATGRHAEDWWARPQGGYRFDWTPTGADSLTLQGDTYDGTEATLSTLSGGNMQAHWTHGFRDGGSLQVQGYYDRTERENDAAGGSGFWLDTYDLEVQDATNPSARNAFVWGGGVRLSRYDITGTPTLMFAPQSRTLDLSDVFVQDTLSVTRATKLVLGMKLEDDPYSGVTPLPSLRFEWTPSDTGMLWAAVSRAIRSPTPFDKDVRELSGASLFLAGNPDFQPETLTAYELGGRMQPTAKVSFSLSAYYNVYDDLRSVDLRPVTFLPLTWGNGLAGQTWGLEGWGDWQVKSWWRLSASVNLLGEHFAFKSGSNAFTPLGVAQLGDDPRSQAQLKSAMDLSKSVFLDADLRYVDKLPQPFVPAYTELNSRIGWRASDRVTVSIAGFNLLHKYHQEFPAPWAYAVPRSVFVELKGRF